jgi:multidrug efflux system membrane fusion protein
LSTKSWTGRGAVIAFLILVAGGGLYFFRADVAAKLGMPELARGAEAAAPAATAQPANRRRANLSGPVPVVVTTVAPKSMPIIVEAVGTVQSISSVQLKSRIDSQIMKVHVEEGALVKEGDLLFELDARTLKAQLAQTEAQIRKDQAQIVQAKRDSVRADDLLTKGAGTIVTRDTNVTTQKALEAQLESDEAMRQNILAQISYTEIRAPVAGRIGSIPNKAGTTLRIADNTATAVLATINQVDPIFVTFALPQVVLPDLRAAMAKGEVTVNALVDETHRQSGGMAFIENAVDPNTGTVTAKARIANASEGLWPGQFVKIELVLGVEAQALSVPAAAIQLGAQGPYVFVIANNVAQVRPLDIKRTQGGESVIGKGLAAGETIVIDGQLRLVNGAPVAVRPPQGEAPKPATPQTEAPKPTSPRG